MSAACLTAAMTNGEFLPVRAAGLAPADDVVLIREAQQGNHAAFEELIRRYDRRVLRLALSFSGANAERAQDIYQEAFLRICRTLKSFRFQCAFYSWVYRIVVNICMDHFRSQKVRGEVSLTGIREDGAEATFVYDLPDTRAGNNPEQAALSGELQRHLSRAFRRLTPRERLVFELRHNEGLRLRAAAAVLNISEAAAKNLLFRATRKLRSALAEAGSAPVRQCRRLQRQ